MIEARRKKKRGRREKGGRNPENKIKGGKRGEKTGKGEEK